MFVEDFFNSKPGEFYLRRINKLNEINKEVSDKNDEYSVN